MDETAQRITQNITDVYDAAFRIAAYRTGSGYRYIRDTFLAALDADPNYTQVQKMAIRLAAEKLNTYREGGPLVGVLKIKWEDIGLPPESVPALDDAGRETIINGIMQVCKGIIDAEAQRLAVIAQLDTTLAVPAQ